MQLFAAHPFVFCSYFVYQFYYLFFFYQRFFVSFFPLIKALTAYPEKLTQNSNIYFFLRRGIVLFSDSGKYFFSTSSPYSSSMILITAFKTSFSPWLTFSFARNSFSSCLGDFPPISLNFLSKLPYFFIH